MTNSLIARRSDATRELPARTVEGTIERVITVDPGAADAPGRASG